jgi:hypothetical protein
MHGISAAVVLNMVLTILRFKFNYDTRIHDYAEYWQIAPASIAAMIKSLRHVCIRYLLQCSWYSNQTS